MFHSTRGNKLVSSPEAILNGLASDGGLYVIDNIPKIDYHDLLDDSYSLMASKILNKLFPEFSIDELLIEIEDAYSSFDIKNVVNLKECDNSYFLELFHGPTLAFKDLALVVLPRLMKLSKKKLGYDKNITILTATSGDTGGAALNGFKNVDGISIAVLYPNGGVSPVQEAQMCSFRADNAVMYAVEGNFDDCQSMVKKFFLEHKDLNLSSANSINIARLAPQIVYYFYSYINLLKENKIKENEKINFVVPTGNFGNIFAGFYAKMMGLPINNLICASNKNNVLTEYFNTNKYNKNREFYKTNSPSMDIIISSNFERFIYYGLNENTSLVKNKMELLANNGEYEFNNPYDYFYGYSIDEKETLNIIKEVYHKYNYCIDPHTAVAYGAYLEYIKNSSDNNKTVVLSTASPFKFPNTVLEALDIKCNDSLLGIKILKETINMDIPKVLNYPDIKREVLALNEVNNKLEDVIKCFESR